ncbi:MAG: sugar phosphate isomerase/epimerase [Angelakisella sp.]
MEAKQIGLACWGLREEPLKTQLKMANDLGVKFLEISIANSPNDIKLSADDNEIAQVRALYEENGLSINYAATGNDFTLESAEEVAHEVEKVKRVIAICSRLHCTHLRIFAGFSAADQVTGKRFEILSGAMYEVARTAREAGICLVVELHGGVNSYKQGVEHFHSVTTRKDKLLSLLEVLPSDVRFLLDPANLWAVGITDPQEYYFMLQERIAYMHCKDFVRIPNGLVLPSACGTGELDWQQFFKTAAAFKGALLVEYENPHDVELGMRESIDFIRCAL